MQNLSGSLPPNPVTPSSMMAVNTTTQDGTGFSGPGSPTELVKPDDAGQIPPLGEIAADKPRSVLVPDGPRGGGPSPVPWTAADGSAWKSASDDEYLPRMQLDRGSWQEV